ncbi:MAG: hypothetical protein KAR13_10940 [Desulfobulbaceae bacterium]|nr:hypothetical protein [Desulfobulbaceae bacterium]
MTKKGSHVTATNVSLDDLREATREELIGTIEKLLAENARLAKQVEQLDAKAKKNHPTPASRLFPTTHTRIKTASNPKKKE